MGERIWLAVGLLGQLLFSGRFLVQWICSESAGRSLIPMGFWYLSLCGSGTLLAYAIYRTDPVFILGQSTGLFIYLRNIHLRRRELTRDAAGGTTC